VIALVIGLLILVLVVTLGIALRVAAHQRWQERSRQIRLDREINQAEWRLHDLAGRAFESMLEVARSHR
jgi:uncharacterized membrane protein YidH (DUF202 family)